MHVEADDISLTAQRHTCELLANLRLSIDSASTTLEEGGAVSGAVGGALGGAVSGAVSGSFASVVLPNATALRAALPPGTREIISQLATFHGNLHSAAGPPVLLLSSTTTLTLRSDGGEEMPLSLPPGGEVVLQLPFRGLPPPPAGGGCFDGSYLVPYLVPLACSGRGNCSESSESCVCEPGWWGRTCNESVGCSFWAELVGRGSPPRHGPSPPSPPFSTGRKGIPF